MAGSVTPASDISECNSVVSTSLMLLIAAFVMKMNMNCLQVGVEEVVDESESEIGFLQLVPEPEACSTALVCKSKKLACIDEVICIYIPLCVN